MSAYAMLGVLANIAIVLLTAPLFQGVQRKITAIVQSRQGPPQHRGGESSGVRCRRPRAHRMSR